MGPTETTKTCAVCESPAKQACSACRGVQYCSRECQAKVNPPLNWPIDHSISTLTISPLFFFFLFFWKDWKAHKHICTKKKSKSPSGLNNSAPGGFQGATLDGRPVQPMPLNVPFPSHLTKYPVTLTSSHKSTLRRLLLPSSSKRAWAIRMSRLRCIAI